MTKDSSLNSEPPEKDERNAEEPTRDPSANGDDALARAKVASDPGLDSELPSTEQLDAREELTVVASERPRPPQGESGSSSVLVLEDVGELQPGQTFGQFQIVRYVGGGGMGRVYEGVDLDLERKVAIKVLSKKNAADSGVVARFLNEAKSAARLNHENIAQVYLSGNIDGTPYIAFEYVDGENLRDYVRERGVLELNEAVDYVLQVADALAHAAAHGVTHRDVKPSNIIVTPQKRVKLIDMGLARLIKSGMGDDLTESGMTLGTFDYISPEQARDPRLADVRSDVYSLGCTFYYMLVGEPPFPEGSPLQKLLMHQGDDAPDVRDSNPSVPAEIAAVVKKMMKKDPSERYQTPETLIDDLRQIVDMLDINVVSGGVARRQERLAKRVSTRLLLSRYFPPAFAVVALLAIVAFLNRGADRGELTPPTIVYSPIANPVEENSGAESENGDRIANNTETTEVATNSQTPDPNRPTPTSVVENDRSILTTSCDVFYEVSDLDAIYSATYGASLETAPASLVQDAVEGMKNYLTDGYSSTTQRTAGGWRAFTIEKNLETMAFNAPTSDRDVETSEPTSHSVTAYSFLSSTRENETAETPIQDPTRIVDGKGAASNAYATLQGALATPSRAANGHIRVELRSNDSLETSAIILTKKNVEIVAGEGFKPTLTFKPGESPNDGWNERMFLLESSSLKLRGVDVDFTVSSQDVVASEWSVFETAGESSLTIERSTITVSNMIGSTFTAPLHSNVAFFRGKADSSLDDWSAGENSKKRPLSMRLDHVFARGEANLFAIDRPEGKFEARDSGFVVSGSFFVYSEREQNAFSDASSFALKLDRSIALCRSSFIRIDSDASAGVWSPFDVDVSDSIIRLNEQPLALINSAIPFEPDDFENRWSLNRSFLIDARGFWRKRMESADGPTEEPLPKNSEAFESANLVELSPDAVEKLTSLPPRFFTRSDFLNWVIAPFASAGELSSVFKEVSDEITRGFIEDVL